MLRKQNNIQFVILKNISTIIYEQGHFIMNNGYTTNFTGTELSLMADKIDMKKNVVESTKIRD